MIENWKKLTSPEWEKLISAVQKFHDADLELIDTDNSSKVLQLTMSNLVWWSDPEGEKKLPRSAAVYLKLTSDVAPDCADSVLSQNSVLHFSLSKEGEFHLVTRDGSREAWVDLSNSRFMLFC